MSQSFRKSRRLLRNHKLCRSTADHAGNPKDGWCTPGTACDRCWDSVQKTVKVRGPVHFQGHSVRSTVCSDVLWCWDRKAPPFALDQVRPHSSAEETVIFHPDQLNSFWALLVSCIDQCGPVHRHDRRIPGCVTTPSTTIPDDSTRAAACSVDDVLRVGAETNPDPEKFRRLETMGG